MSAIYFAKVPLRNACLRVKNRLTSGEQVRWMRRYDIDLVLDVGANNGQYGRHLIGSGYRGRIVSFEPLPMALTKLRMNRWSFSNWQVEPFALGAKNETSSLNIAGNSQSSSLRAMLPLTRLAVPEAEYVSSCQVEVRRLDTVFDRYHRGERCFLKLDVQGHEQEVIAGAGECLKSIVAIQMEVSLEPLYEGELDWQASIARLDQLGYKLMSITPGFQDKRTGQMMQADAIFVQKQEVQRLTAGSGSC